MIQTYIYQTFFVRLFLRFNQLFKKEQKSLIFLFKEIFRSRESNFHGSVRL